MLNMVTFWRFRNCVEIVFFFDIIKCKEPHVSFDLRMNPYTDEKMCDDETLAVTITFSLHDYVTFHAIRCIIFTHFLTFCCKIID